MRTPKWLLEADDVEPPPGDGPAILIFDVETSPHLAYVWQLYKADALQVVKPWYLLSVAYKWHGADDTHFIGINQDPKFKPDHGWGKPRKNVDRYVVARLWHLFDKADVVVAHNGDRFDIKKVNARIMTHKLKPPSPYKSIDTLKEVRRYANFGSHRLNSLGKQLELGEKTPHSGLHTWFGCMAGDPEQWDRMEQYNIKDVLLLEELFDELVPWIGMPGKSNPGVNAAAFSDGVTCPKNGCGGKGELVARGFQTSSAGLRYQRFQCKKCGGYSRARYAERDLHPTPVK